MANIASLTLFYLGFKVKTFHVKDANLFQINADFDRLTESGDKKTVSRALFSRGNAYPQKKVITYSKNKEDFEIAVNYGEPVPQDSVKNIYKVSILKCFNDGILLIGIIFRFY